MKPGPAAVVGLLLCRSSMEAVSAEDATAVSPPNEERWSIHAQATSFSNGHGSFPSPYQGQNSLDPHEPLIIYHGFHLSPGFQWIHHPGYDRDRGPVSIGVIRAHAEF